jgi:hypothetical protein
MKRLAMFYSLLAVFLGYRFICDRSEHELFTAIMLGFVAWCGWRQALREPR